MNGAKTTIMIITMVLRMMVVLGVVDIVTYAFFAVVHGVISGWSADPHGAVDLIYTMIIWIGVSELFEMLIEANHAKKE